MDSTKPDHPTRKQPRAQRDHHIAPGTKATYGTVAAAITTILVWGLGAANVNMPAEVAAAVTTLITAVTVYFVKERNPHAVAEHITMNDIHRVQEDESY